MKKVLEATRWISHYLRTLVPDYESRLTSYTESFDANEVTLANKSISHITSVTIDVGDNEDGYNWSFTNWGSSTASTVLSATSAGSKITEVKYKTGQPYCVIGFPKWGTKFPVVSIDYSFNLGSGGLGRNSPTVASGDNITYSNTVSVWAREGEAYAGTSLTDFALVDSMVEVIANGVQEKGTGAGNPIPYPFKDLNVLGCSKLLYEESVGAFHKDITVEGKTKMDLANSKW